MFNIAEVVHILRTNVTKSGEQSVNYDENTYHVENGDFVFILCNDHTPSPISYMTDLDLGYISNDLDFTMVLPDLTGTTVGSVFELNTNETRWTMERKVFSMVFTITSSDTHVHGEKI